MKLKTFRARSMAQALAEVKKDLGKDAVILHTRAYRVGGVMGVGGHQEFEITAADQLSQTLEGGGAAMGAGAGLSARGPRIRDGRANQGVLEGLDLRDGLDALEQALPNDAQRADRPGVATLMTRLPIDKIAAESARDFVPMTYSALGGTVAPRAASDRGNPAQRDDGDRGSVEVLRGGASGAGTPGPITPGPITPNTSSPSTLAPSTIKSAGRTELPPTSVGASMPFVEPKPPSRSSSTSAGASTTSHAKPAEPAAASAVGERIAPTNPLATRVDVDATLEDATVTLLREEIGAIRRMVGQLVTQSRSAGAQLGATFTGSLASQGASGSATAVGFGLGVASSMLDTVGMAQPLLETCLRLQDVGVRQELVDEIVGLARDELTPEELRDASIVRVCVERHLAAAMPACGVATKAGQRPGVQGTRPLTIALVGPTGVGKTTTVAKLAAAYKLRYGASVGLITCDTYRIAAVEQLRTYASIIGLPLKVCLTPHEVSEACDALRGCDVVLMDSAGRSQHDSARLDELSAFVRAAQPDEVHLVLSASASPDVLQDASRRFATLGPTALMVTKLDEAVRFGMLPGLCKDAALKLSYVTTGQEVPEHIELANAQRLARLVLDGKLRA